MYLVLIETAGNQDYIFASNKLREAVGASQLTYQVGVKAKKEADRIGLPDKYELLATSGKAMFLTDNDGQAKQIIGAVTRWALEDAPGMDVRGVFCEVDQQQVHVAVAEVHKLHANLVGRIPGPRQRFQRLPVGIECKSSGLPAAHIGKFGGKDNGPQSTVTKQKRAASEDGWIRMQKLAPDGVRLAHTIEELEDDLDLDWLAVIHADGNGIGEMFLKFHKFAGGDDIATYQTKYAAFSRELDQCTTKAFQHALAKLHRGWEARRRAMQNPPKMDWLPIVPLVVGGDDLTVVCDGRLAMTFTVAYLAKFREVTERMPTIHSLAKHGYLAACAGIAIVKPHFPFHAAYQLADDLGKSAKTVKERLPNEPACALDFHIHYDASGSDLKTIRSRLVIDGTTQLIARPYLVTDVKDPIEWSKRRIGDLEKCVNALRPDADGRRCLPSSMLHELRAGLFMGRDAAESRCKQAKDRHDEEHHRKAWKDLLTDGEKLYWDETETDKNDKEIQVAYTHFLDAMDLADFWLKEENQS